jgi:hypothetical protein
MVLIEYNEEMKLKAKSVVVKMKQAKGFRKRVDLPQNEKLYISYLVSLRDMLNQSSQCFHKLKILSTED